MRIYVDNNNMYTVQAASLNTSLSLSTGAHDVVIVAWDSNGTPYRQEFNITVTNSPPPPPSGSGITISAPAAGSTVGAPVHVVASANIGATVSAMRIYLDNNNMYTVNASNIDTTVNAGNGSHDLVIVAWDTNGNPYRQEINFNVGSGNPPPPPPPSGNGLTISTPGNGATVSSPIHVVASASAGSPIAAMRIYLDGNDMYTTQSNQMDTTVGASGGSHNLAVVAWDSNGTP